MWDYLNREIQKQDEAGNSDSNNEHCQIEVNQKCPRCGQGKLDYNSLLNLFCPLCDFETGASFT